MVQPQYIFAILKVAFGEMHKLNNPISEGESQMSLNCLRY